MSKKTPEDKAKDKVKAIIEEVCTRRGLKFEIDWHAGTAYTSTLDASGAIAGHPFVAEVKRMDEDAEPTGRQKLKIKAFREAGVYVFDLVDPTSLLRLREWLEALEPREAFEL